MTGGVVPVATVAARLIGEAGWSPYTDLDDARQRLQQHDEARLLAAADAAGVAVVPGWWGEPSLPEAAATLLVLDLAAESRAADQAEADAAERARAADAAAMASWSPPATRITHDRMPVPQPDRVAERLAAIAARYPLGLGPAGPELDAVAATMRRAQAANAPVTWGDGA